MVDAWVPPDERLGVPPREKVKPASKSNQLNEPTYVTDHFAAFWSAYPRKEGKAKAAKTWKTQKLDSLADKIIADVDARIADPKQWDVAQFIPHPTTYLNQRRWEDEWPRAPAQATQPGMLLRESEERAAEINAIAFERLGLTP